MRAGACAGTPLAFLMPNSCWILVVTTARARRAPMNIRPLSDRIVVRRFEAEEKTAGGILLPDNARNKPQRGKILAVGPGRLLKDGTRRPLQVKAGDTVLFTTWAGDEFKQGRTEDVLLMREEDVL